MGRSSESKISRRRNGANAGRIARFYRAIAAKAREYSHFREGGEMAEMRFHQGFWPELTSNRITAVGQDQKNDLNWRIIVIQNSRLPIIMTLSVRLSPHLRQQLDSYCKTRRVSKTRLIHDLLTDHLSSTSAGGKTPYELAREYGVIGSFSSGKGDLAENRKQYLAEKLRAKHSR